MALVAIFFYEISMPSPISSSTLSDIKEYARFEEFVETMYREFTEETGINLSFNEFHLKNCHEFWLADLKALEPQVNGEPCHFKQCAFLAFWLRREPPVLQWDFDGCYETGEKWIDYKTDFLGLYGREWFAFRLGYEILLYRECNSVNGGPYDKSKFDLTQKLVVDTCYFLKKKSVSPHALYLVYYSIFMDANPKLGARY